MNKTEILGNGEKTILILTGVHGDEVTPVHCGMLLKEYEFDKNNFKKITILNAININGIKKNSRDIPNNSTSDLNRMFGNDITNFKTELLEYFNSTDIIIDIHSSPYCTEFILINQDEYANSYIEFAKKNDINYLVRYSDANTIKKFGLNINKISFTIEINKLDYIDFDSSKRCLDLVLKIINTDIEIKSEEPKYDTYDEFFSYKEGLFISNFKVGDIISKNDNIGYVLDLTTFEKFDIIYKKDKARIICFSDKQYVSGGNCIYFLQKIE